MVFRRPEQYQKRTPLSQTFVTEDNIGIGVASEAKVSSPCPLCISLTDIATGTAQTTGRI